MKATSDPISLIRQLIEKAKYKDGHIEASYIDTFQVNDLIKAGKYNEIVDLRCVMYVLAEIVDRELQEHNLQSLSPKYHKSVAEEVHCRLKSYPQRYQFLVPIPDLQGVDLPSIDPKNNHFFSIKCFDEDDLNNFNDSRYVENPKTLSELSSNLKNFGGVLPPHFKKNDCFLMLNATGYVNKYGDFSVYGYDPLYVIKIFVSLHIIYGSFLDSGNAVNESDKKFPGFYIFSSNHEFIKSVAQINEMNLLRNIAFDYQKSKVFPLINQLFFQLLVEHNENNIKKLQSQVSNSLYWFYEAINTNSHSLKTVFYVTAFDAFFTQEDKSVTKIERIVQEVSETVAQEDLAREHLNAQYKARNQIIHGERRIFMNSHDSRSDRMADFARNEISMKIFYARYLESKLSKLSKSINK